MGRHSPSYSPSPRRDYRRRRSPSPRGHYARREPPTSLLVRNISRNCRPEDLRVPFERFGPLRDVYLPKDYHTGEPRGFGFVQYLYPEDAADAQYEMDRQLICGREITVVFAEESRKTPSDMRSRDRNRGRAEYGRRYHSPYRGRSRSRSSYHYSRSPTGGRYSRSYSPSERRYYDHSYYASPVHDHH